MTTITLAEAEHRFGVTHLDHLDREADVPTVSRLGFQGDVAIIRRDDLAQAATPVPPAGVPIVKGEHGGNTHLLVAAGDVRCDVRAADARNLALAVITVSEEATALLSHPEHGGLLIGPGTYRLSRQREQADELRMVAD